MKKRITILAMMAALLLAALAASPVSAAAVDHDGPPATHIIVFNDGVDAPGAANSLARAHGLTVNNVYTHALRGMAAVVPAGRLKALAKDPRVAFVEPNQVVNAFPQELPTGIDRADADKNAAAQIDGVDERVNIDIAIIDTGIDLDHPDLNVYRWTNCARGGPFNTSCKVWDSGADDGNGHGTHVAGTAAAKDNGDGVVGMAPGARLWAVKVLANDGSGWMNWIIAGIDYVAMNAASIDVANMSLGCACSSAALDSALTNVIASGVTFAVAAGNSMSDSAGFSPANHPDVITVSAVADFDGQPGGQNDQVVAFSSCTESDDDSLACFSNYGAAVDIAAPGVNILSTYMGGGTATFSGTSMASPHVAGAAALLLAGDSGLTPDEVRTALVSSGWDQAGPNGFDGDVDGFAEPMLNVGGGWTPPPPANLVSISVTPDSTSIEEGQTQQFTAVGAYDDSSVADITTSVAWSSNSVHASIDTSGMATGMSEGAAGITGSLEDVTSNIASLTVTPPPALTSITVSPASASIQAGETQQFTAVGAYDDGSVADFTTSAAWSSNSAAASIDATGMATGLSEGAAGISASLEGVTSNIASLTVTPPPDLMSITVSPASTSVQAGETQQFTATGTYTDSSFADLTTSVVWSSGSLAASIDATGLATGVSEGTAGIWASLDGMTSDTATLTITAPPATATIVSVDSITHTTKGGKNGDKDLLITIGVADDLGNAVEGASVSILLSNYTTGQSWIGTGSTRADGTVTFKLRNAPGGCYSTAVFSVVADGLLWDFNPGPATALCKSLGSNSQGHSEALQTL